jgi:hypothetical protein
MSDNFDDEVQLLLDNGLAPEERARFDQWELGLTSEFWNSQIVPYLRTELAKKEQFCTQAEDEIMWRLTQGEILGLKRLLSLRDYIRTTYAQTASSRLQEMEESLDQQAEDDTPDFA